MSYTKKSVKKSRAYRKIKKMISGLTLFVLFFAAAAAVVIIFARNPVSTNASDKGTGTKYYKSVVVQNGDSLWSIADRYMEPSEYKDQREYISEIMSINGLKSEKITYGEHIIVSYYVYE